LLEQKYRIDPSFRTYIDPVAGGYSFPQKEHRTIRGIGLHLVT